MSANVNVADRLAQLAAERGDQLAVVCPRLIVPGQMVGTSRSWGESGAAYATSTFAGLDRDASQLARGLVATGVTPGTRLALLVPPSIELVTLVFALLRAGAVTILVDSGLGRSHLIRCLVAAKPEGFVGISLAHILRTLRRAQFPAAKYNVTVGRRWWWRGTTLSELRRLGQDNANELPQTAADDPAAVIFTSGSTGPPKGVVYTHRMFETQVREIQSMYDIEPGGVDLACFPLFGLFNSAMGVTTVLPQMDFSRPAKANPKKLLRAARDWRVTQSFASPAVWEKLSTYCEANKVRIESLRQIFSCGAPVPAKLLKRTLPCGHPDAEMHTPYGATECLPVSTIEASEILTETAEKTDEGAGMCVGRPFDTIEWRVIRITDEPIAHIDFVEQLPPGEIGELIVRAPQTSPAYVAIVHADGHGELTTEEDHDPNDLAKIPDGNTVWHRMGDVGYLDDQNRFWYCGRKSQRVETREGTLYTIPVEGIFNSHHYVRRSALVSFGPTGEKRPAIVLELERSVLGPFLWKTDWDDQLIELSKRYSHTSAIQRFIPRDHLPVDIRHNSKIRREELAKWANKKIRNRDALALDSRLSTLSSQLDS